MLLYNLSHGKDNINHNILLNVLLRDDNIGILDIISSHVQIKNKIVLFRNACKKGHILCAKWLYNKYNINIEIDENTSLYFALSNGHLDIAKWIIDITHTPLDHTILNFGFCKACENGHLTTAKYIYDNYDINIHNTDDYALRWSSMNGKFDIVKWLIDTCLSIDSICDDNIILAFYNSIISGNINILLYLLDSFDFLKDIINVYYDDIFYLAISNGNLNTCIYIWGFYKGHVIKWNNLFVSVCEFGYYNICEWLSVIHENYKYKQLPSYEIDVDNLIKIASSHLYYNIIEWLIEKYYYKINVIQLFITLCGSGPLRYVKSAYYSLLKYEIILSNNYGFRNACIGGQFEIAKWLYKKNPITTLNNDFNYIFRIVCKNGHHNIAEWLLVLCPDIDIRSYNDYAFNMSCENNHITIAKLLCSLCPEYHIIVICGCIIEYKVRNILYEAKDNLEHNYDDALKILNISKTCVMNDGENCSICSICSICYDEFNKIIKTPCNHYFCLRCLLEWCIISNIKKDMSCAYCRTKYNWIDCSNCYNISNIN
jgi:hypothetical protein